MQAFLYRFAMKYIIFVAICYNKVRNGAHCMRLELEEYKGLSVAEILKLLREDNDYTQDDVAHGTHIVRGTYTHYELGKRQPDLDKLKTIADFYHVPPAIFFGRSIPPFMQGIKIPVLKKIIPDTPLDAPENIEGYEEISPSLAANGEYFALKIKELSMYPYYLEGDTLIVRKQTTAEQAAMVVVTVGSAEAVIRKIQIQPNGITLAAFNTMVEIPYSYSKREMETLPIKIIGVVAESHRQEK